MASTLPFADAKRHTEKLKLSPESQRRKDQEQAALQAQLRHEKQEAQRQRDFANSAMEVLTAAPKTPAPATKVCETLHCSR